MAMANAEEGALMASDKKYRQYVTEVDRSLRAFEYTSEWADLIAALGRLNKVLTQNNKYQVNTHTHFSLRVSNPFLGSGPDRG